jgi:hypothetical protein
LKRYAQTALWAILAPVFGAIQAVASFSVIMLSVGDLGSHDLRRVIVGLSLAYGSGWFIPALVVSDLAMLRRSLSRKEFGRYILLIALTALVIGLMTSGMMVMLGYPTTACAILLYGFIFRKRSSAVAGEKVILSQ